jgi:hypothetical protein
MSKKRHSSLQPQGPGETGRWAVPQIVILGLFLSQNGGYLAFFEQF